MFRRTMSQEDLDFQNIPKLKNVPNSFISQGSGRLGEISKVTQHLSVLWANQWARAWLGRVPKQAIGGWKESFTLYCPEPKAWPTPQPYSTPFPTHPPVHWGLLLTLALRPTPP